MNEQQNILLKARDVLHEERAPAMAIDIQNLVVKYGSKRAVDGLTFAVPVGSIFGFLGPNGSGKTTTIKTLLGFRPPNAGRAEVFGYDVVSQSMQVRARAGYVSETNSLYDYLTIPQLCAFCRSVNQEWHQEVVDRYIGLFGLPPKEKVENLSKGMKSQLALSVALGSNPDVLILDEPTSGLDPVARHEFLNTLVVDIATRGKTIFFSSHILSEVEAVADRVAIIHAGTLVVCDELSHLKRAKKVVKLTYVDLPPASEIEALRHVPQVTNVVQEGRCVRLLTEENADTVEQTLKTRPYALQEVETVDLGLEDLFLESMKEVDHGH